MKRVWTVLLVLLLLAGCTAGEPDMTTQQSTAEQTQEPTDPGLYAADSAAEQQTGGAVRMYLLEGSDYCWIGTMGSELLLATGGSNGSLSVLSGENCVLRTSAAFAELQLGSELAAICPSAGGVTYYSQTENEIVHLDRQLQEVARIPLPADISGKPVIAQSSAKVYYCVGMELRELDTDTRISRLVRQFSGTSLTLLDSYCGGEVLLCRAAAASGEIVDQYISAMTGAAVHADAGLLSLDTYADSYFAVRLDGIVQQQIFGIGEAVGQLNVEQGSGSFVNALALGGMVHAISGEDGSLQLTYYDLTTGKRTSAVTVNGLSAPTAYCADLRTGSLWFLSRDQQTGKEALYRWEIAASPVTDETVYTGTYFTAGVPDTVGLGLCQERVDALNKTYVLDIRIWQDALDGSESYPVIAEHQVGVISAMLDSLEQVLSRFPEDFLDDTADGMDSGRLKLRLVRSVNEGSDSLHYWHDGDLYIVICSGADAGWELLESASYAVITHILGNAEELDYWTGLNPVDFVYGIPEGQYMDGASRAFVDAAAMDSVTADRALTFAYAMAEGRDNVFASEIMQAKLKLLCQGIRDAYRLTRYEQALPWEQYLNESLAYTK